MFLTILIFTVRITSLRTVLLSIVFSGLLCLLLGLVLILVLESNMFAIRDVYVVLTILWLTYLSVIALSIFSNKKQYRGIAMNTSLFWFSTYNNHYSNSYRREMWLVVSFIKYWGNLLLLLLLVQYKRTYNFNSRDTAFTCVYRTLHKCYQTMEGIAGVEVRGQASGDRYQGTGLGVIGY